MDVVLVDIWYKFDTGIMINTYIPVIAYILSYALVMLWV